jgi:RNA polymerase sigma-70 factor (ECF subfamily)
MESLSHLSDDELLFKFQSGNHHAYEIIYNRYWKLLYRHANAMLRNEEEAKDVVQDVFTNLWLKANASLINTPLASFLFCATRNNILNRLKHLKVEARFNEHIQHAFDHLTELPDSLIIEKELAKQIEEGTQVMPEKMRQIFMMSRTQHLTHKEISEQLKISDKTVKRQISNALNILRVKLELYKFLIYLFLIYIL